MDDKPQNPYGYPPPGYGYGPPPGAAPGGQAVAPETPGTGGSAGKGSKNFFPISDSIRFFRV